MSTPARVRMVPASLRWWGRRLHYAVSDNAEASLWAVDVHGYFAGGGMYWREAARLAGLLGWRVVTPNLPGFAGSDPLSWEELSMRSLAEAVAASCDHAGAGRVVLLGHSMGAAVATQFAVDFPARTLGLVYRDGAATPSWKVRGGPLVALLGGVAPDIGALADLLLAAVADVPDLMAGRVLATARATLPDFSRNVRSLARTIPVAALLFSCDLR
ncbi:MAG: hypothetical protein C4344_06055, partial [Acidimicrobiia bacterium]